MRIAHRVLPGLVAGSLLLGGASGVFAANAGVKAPRAHLAVVSGQVSNVQSSAFTVTFTPKKTGVAPKIFQVTTTATTKHLALKGTTGALTNGEYAIVIGAKTTTGVTARTVRYSVTPFKARQVRILRLRLELAALTAMKARTVRGTVNATQPAAGVLAITVTTKKGAVTRSFTISPTTKYFVGKTPATSAPAFTSGEKVAIHFKRDKTTKALDALAIRVLATA